MSTLGRTIEPERQLLLALQRAQNILAQHVEPGGPDEKATIDALLAVLDDQEVVQAVLDLRRKMAGSSHNAD